MKPLASIETFRARQRPEAADVEDFRFAMRQLASGVCLLTHGLGDARTGMTVTSVSSLSADPPTLLVCFNKSASIYSGLRVGERFGVNVLSSEQKELADVFAGRTGLKGAQRFEQGRWLTTPRGVPLLLDAMATFECELDDLIERHTHAIAIGRVLHASQAPRGGALVYWRGGYDQLGWSAEEVSRAVGLAPATGR